MRRVVRRDDHHELVRRELDWLFHKALRVERVGILLIRRGVHVCRYRSISVSSEPEPLKVYFALGSICGKTSDNDAAPRTVNLPLAAWAAGAACPETAESATNAIDDAATATATRPRLALIVLNLIPPPVR